MDLKHILSGLEDGLAAAKKIASIGAAVGIPYAGVAESLLEVAENIREKMATGEIVATSDDYAKVAAIIVDLQAENDRLAAEIDAS